MDETQWEGLPDGVGETTPSCQCHGPQEHVAPALINPEGWATLPSKGLIYDRTWVG